MHSNSICNITDYNQIFWINILDSSKKVVKNIYHHNAHFYSQIIVFEINKNNFH